MPDPYFIFPGGLIKESYRYDAFGAPTIRNNVGTIIPSSTIGNRFLFTGREYNSQFGFYEYRARAYHPGLGRFMSEDPIGFDGGDYNLYRYCHNDPLDLTDPMGLSGDNKAVWRRYPIPSPYGYEMDKWDRIRAQQTANVSWRPRVIRYGRWDVYNKKGERLAAATYNTLSVAAEGGDDGTFKRAIIQPQTVVEFAESAGPKTRQLALERERDHEHPIRWWAGHQGREIAQSEADRHTQLRSSAAEAARAIDRALRPSFQKANDSTKHLDWKPWAVGGHQLPKNLPYEE